MIIVDGKNTIFEKFVLRTRDVIWISKWIMCVSYSDQIKQIDWTFIFKNFIKKDKAYCTNDGAGVIINRILEFYLI